MPSAAVGSLSDAGMHLPHHPPTCCTSHTCWLRPPELDRSASCKQRERTFQQCAGLPMHACCGYLQRQLNS